MKPFYLLILLLIGACSSSINDYKKTEPTLALETFFNGNLVAYGIVQNPSGKVIQRFKADLIGTWQGNKGVLDEQFYYADGTTGERTWYLEKHPNGAYSGTASDVSGTAQGYARGFALNWEYTLQLPINGKTWELKLDDWMYLIDENRMINRTDMRKWGIKLGELTLWIEKVP